MCVSSQMNNKDISVVVPGSKSITNRALLIAAMANGKSTLKGCLTSDDATHFLECIKALGFPVEIVSDGKLGVDITIAGFGGEIPNKKAELYVGSAGTAARFLVAMLAFRKGDYIIRSSEQMKKRPMQPLIETLRSAGALVECLEEEGHFPLHIVGVGDKKDIPSKLTVNIDKSSQFLSALLIAAGTFGQPVEILVNGSHGLSYVDLTADMMKSFGVTVWKAAKESDQKEDLYSPFSGPGEGHKTEPGSSVIYKISGTEKYHALSYEVEPDMSAAAYFYALAAILGIRISVKGVTDHMLQGDTQFLQLLQRMGCKTCGGQSDSACPEIVLQGPENGRLKGGFTVDMSAFSDQALTLAAIAPFAKEPVGIEGISHIRLQECDRINAIKENLAELGVRVEETENGLRIYPAESVKPCQIKTYDDQS